jgi:hypothetical protein
MADFLESLQHSWGKSPKQKAREKEYNAEYYRKHKEKWLNTNRPLTDTIRGYQDALLDSGKSYSVKTTKPIRLHNGRSVIDQIHDRSGETGKRHGGLARNVNVFSDYYLGDDKVHQTVLVRPTTYRKQVRAVEKAAKEFKSNWKIGAAAISDSAKKGADFVKNLFK